ncbi:MAG: GGDEF domain-containing protein [Solirubrobacteraceae bacterium]|nr:GGDEF domain-containing protein [Solirubrobacteraceae bacterium]
MPTALPEAARRALKPLPDLDSRTRRAWTATQSGDRKAARQIGDQFLVAAVTAAAVALVAPQAVTDSAYLFGIAVCALLFGVYLRFSLYVGELSVDRAITAALLLVAGTCFIARPMQLLPMLYLWPLILSAQYALPGRLATNLVLSLITFGFTVGTVADSDSHKASAVIFSVVIVGVTLAYRRLRRHVAELLIRLEELSARDPLTGALTQERFERALHAWVGHGMRRQVETSLVILDVDHMAKLNAAHGHEVGDAALQHLARVVYDAIRETDAFGRLDGAQFGLLLPATRAIDAVTAAERIRETLERRASESGVDFTVSIGIAGEHSHDDPWAAARRGLELAKDTGGNRVVLAEATDVAGPRAAEADLAPSDAPLADAA